MTEVEIPSDGKVIPSRKQRTFTDPCPGEIFVSIVSKLTEAEKAILAKFSFDKVSTNGDAYMLAGFIARDSVDLARYMRSIDEQPDKTDHFERLISSAEQSPNGWVHHYITGDNEPSVVDDAIKILEAVDWSECDIMPVFDEVSGQIYFESPTPQEEEVA